MSATPATIQGAVHYSTKIPNNVGLAHDGRVLKALGKGPVRALDRRAENWHRQ